MFSNRFIQCLQIGIAVGGIILCFIPVILAWKFPIPITDTTFENLPIIRGIKSLEYKMSLIASMSMSIHMLMDLVGHAILSRENIFSYRDFVANMILLICLLVPDLIQYFYIIPHVEYVMFHCIQYIRFILLSSATFGYLSEFGGKYWTTFEVVIVTFSIGCGSILRFYSCYYTNNELIIFEVATFFSFGIATIYIIISLNRWIREVCLTTHDNRSNGGGAGGGFYLNKSLTFDQYCCNIYLFAGILTVSGLWILIIAFRMPLWYEYDNGFLASETMLFSMYYVIVTVFQGRVTIWKAAISKVLNSSYTHNNYTHNNYTSFPRMPLHFHFCFFSFLNSNH